jgi:hypothetical protein
MPNPILKIEKSDHSDSDAEKFNALLLELYENYTNSGANTYSLSKFELIKTLHHSKTGRRFGIKNQSNKECYLVGVQYAYRYSEVEPYEMAKTFDEYRIYPFYLFQHTTDLGHTLIRPETIADKISELFKPIEIDFKKHKKFSFKYYVTTEDSDLVKKNMPYALLDYLKSKKGISIEFMNDWCLVRNDKVISTKNGLDLCQIAFEVKAILDSRG